MSNNTSNEIKPLSENKFLDQSEIRTTEDATVQTDINTGDSELMEYKSP